MFYLITKKCFKCKQIKIINDFYRHSHMADGFLNKCKNCLNKYNREHYKNHIEYYKAHMKIYNQTEKGKIIRKEATSKWRKNNPEKIMANNAVNNALHAKKFFKEPCKKCGDKENIEGHHEDYDKPLEVIWLCRQHHFEIHKTIMGRRW